MKKLLFISLLFFIGSISFAQNNNWSKTSLGIKTTAAKSFYKDYHGQGTKLKIDLFDKTKGYSYYSFGLTARRSFSDSSRFSLEAGVLWAKYIFYRNATFTGPPSDIGYVTDYNLSSNRIVIPLSLNYHLLSSNKLIPILHFGVKPGLYANSKEDFLYVIKQSGKETYFKDNFFGDFNITCFLGAGVDWYAGKYIVNFNVQLQYDILESSPSIAAAATEDRYTDDDDAGWWGEGGWETNWGGDLYTALNLTIYRR